MRSRKRSVSEIANKVASTDDTSVDRERSQGGSRGASSLHLQDQIGTQLKAVYDEFLDTEIPERFVDLLNKLERGGEDK